MTEHDTDSFDCPEEISGEGQEFWLRLLRTCERERIRVAHRWDLLVRYTQTWALWRECCQGIADEGQVVESVSPEGFVERKRNSRMIDYASLSRLLAQCAAELGLSSKARLEAEGDEEEPQGEDADAGDGLSHKSVVYRIDAR